MSKPIINGIDVSECKYLNKVVNEEPYCDIDEEHLYTCSSDENCYFKQLKRLQQELDIKEKMLDKFMIGSGETLEKLQKENEELRQVRKNSPDIQEPYVYLYRQIKEQCHKLEEENEKLKEDLKGETEQAQKWYQLETDKHFQMLKYKQALEEIRSHCNNYAKTESYVIDDTFNEFLEIIFNKINEVLNDRN